MSRRVSPSEPALTLCSSLQALQAVTPDIVKNIKLLFRLWDLKHSLVSSSSASLDASLSLTQNDCFEVALDLNFTAQDIISTIAFGQGYNMLSDTIEEVEKEGRRSDGSFPRKNNELADASRVFFQVGPLSLTLSNTFKMTLSLLYGFLRLSPPPRSSQLPPWPSTDSRLPATEPLSDSFTASSTIASSREGSASELVRRVVRCSMPCLRRS